jgi:hypothetical protein
MHARTRVRFPCVANTDLDRAAHQILVALKRGPNGKLKIELTTVYQTTK